MVRLVMVLVAVAVLSEDEREQSNGAMTSYLGAAMLSIAAAAAVAPFVRMRGARLFRLAACKLLFEIGQSHC
jgi:hypothetical protein